MKESPVQVDVLLEPLLKATDEQQAEELLLQLINTHAEPVIKGVIRFKLRLSSYHASQQAEADDIYQEVVLQLLAQLQLSTISTQSPQRYAAGRREKTRLPDFLCKVAEGSSN